VSDSRELARCRSFLATRVSEQRRLHCERTYECARNLLRHFSLDLDGKQLLQVTLLHDCAREADPRELASLVDEAHLATVPGGSSNIGLVHGLAGARLVQRELGITDPCVLFAITHHATGIADPSELLTVQIIADYLEPGRPFAQDAPDWRDYDSLLVLARDVLSRKIGWLLSQQCHLALESVEAYNWYLLSGAAVAPPGVVGEREDR